MGPIREGKFGGLSRSKPYSRLAKFQGNRIGSSGSKSVVRSAAFSENASVGGSVSTPFGRCKKCGQRGHEHYNYPNKEITCFNCNGKGHISIQCPHPPKARIAGVGSQFKRPKAIGRVFALSGAEAAQSENLIQGTCFIAENPFVVLFDSGATHSFISLACVMLEI